MVDDLKIDDVYTIDKTLGNGTYGEVKRAIHNDTGEIYAVKIINIKDLNDDDMLNLQ